MLRSRTGASMRSIVVLAAVTALGCAIGAPAASAHAGGSSCFGDLGKVSATYQGECEFPFQGYPIGMAGVYRPSTTDPNPRFSEIHVEALVKPAFGTPYKLNSMECYNPEPNSEGVIPQVLGETRCRKEFQTPHAEEPFTLVEPIPTEIVSMLCSAHSHSFFSNFHPPSGKYACWSTDEARDDLEADHVFEEMGFE